MSLLKCLHVMDENVTHPFLHPEPSLTPSHMHMPSVRKHYFQNKMFLFLKTHYSISDKILLDNPLNKYIGQSSEVNCWTTLQNNQLDILRRELLDNFPKQFFGQLVTPPTRHPKWMSSKGVTLRDCDSLTFFFLDF